MSPFWSNFEGNVRSRDEAVSNLRDALAEVCEDFAAENLPFAYKRNILLRELNQLLTHYRDSTNWPADKQR
jgi:hypothetical protein